MLTFYWGTVESRWWPHRPARSRRRRKRSPSRAADRSDSPGRRTPRRSASTHPGNHRQPRSLWPLCVALLRAARAAKNARRAHNVPRRVIRVSMQMRIRSRLVPAYYCLTSTIKSVRYPYTNITSFIHCGVSYTRTITTDTRAELVYTHVRRKQRAVFGWNWRKGVKWSRDGRARRDAFETSTVPSLLFARRRSISSFY